MTTTNTLERAGAHQQDTPKVSESTSSNERGNGNSLSENTRRKRKKAPSRPVKENAKDTEMAHRENENKSRAGRQGRSFRDYVYQNNPTLSALEKSFQDRNYDDQSNPRPTFSLDSFTQSSQSHKGQNLRKAQDIINSINLLNNALITAGVSSDVQRMLGNTKLVGSNTRHGGRGVLQMNAVVNAAAVFADPNATDDQKAKAVLSVLGQGITNIWAVNDVYDQIKAAQAKQALQQAPQQAPQKPHRQTPHADPTPDRPFTGSQYHTGKTKNPTQGQAPTRVRPPAKKPNPASAISYDQFKNGPQITYDQFKNGPQKTSIPRAITKASGAIGPMVNGIASGVSAVNGIVNWDQLNVVQKAYTVVDTSYAAGFTAVGATETAVALTGAKLANKLAGFSWTTVGLTGAVSSAVQFAQGVNDIIEGRDFSGSTNIIAGLGGALATGLAVAGSTGVAVGVGAVAAAPAAAVVVADSVQNSNTSWAAKNAEVVGKIEQWAFKNAVESTEHNQQKIMSVAGQREKDLGYSFDSVWNSSHQADFLANQNNDTRYVPPKYHHETLDEYPSTDRHGGHRTVGSEDSYIDLDLSSQQPAAKKRERTPAYKIWGNSSNNFNRDGVEYKKIDELTLETQGDYVQQTRQGGPGKQKANLVVINGDNWRRRESGQRDIPTTVGGGAAAKRRLVTDPKKPSVIVVGRDFHDTQIHLRNKGDRVIFAEQPTKNIKIISDYQPNINFDFAGSSNMTRNRENDQTATWTARGLENGSRGRIGQTHDTYSINDKPLINVYHP